MFIYSCRLSRRAYRFGLSLVRRDILQLESYNIQAQINVPGVSPSSFHCGDFADLTETLVPLGCGNEAGKAATHVSGYLTVISKTELGFPLAAHFRAQLRLDPSDVPNQDEETWILLTRHLRSHRTQQEYIALTADSGFGTGVPSGHDVLSTKVRLK